MAKKKKFYITTAIDYVNARPHIGHAFEKVVADAIARWHKLRGGEVFLLTGTDENAQKNAQAAKEASIPAQKFVDQNSKIFIELCKKLNVDYDDFIRTTEPRHKKIAKELFQKVYDKGDIYKSRYEGLYCQGCEAFITEKDLVDGKCPEHNKEPKEMSEDAYFFKLSKYRDQIISLVEHYVIPKTRKNEILQRLKEEKLRDLCVSRTGLDWGIDSPIDPKFKIYVWFDALINYISGANNNWPADIHVIGKGINWFHSVIWPAILMSAGYELPKKLLVHGYLNFGGMKISKTLGNVVDPIGLVERYGVDAVRYSLLRCSVYEDSDYSEEILVERNNNELANKLGNLVSRVSALAEKYGLKECKNLLLKKLGIKQIEKYFDKFELDKALNEIFAFIDICNEYVQEKKPWETKDKEVLYGLVDSLKAIAILLWPFIPQTSAKIAKQFGFELSYANIQKPLGYKTIKKSEPLFNKLEVKETIPAVEGVITMDQINYEDFEKADLRVGTIKKVEDIEEADNLYKLTVDLGETEERIIVAGIKKNYDKDELIGKQIVVVCNLAPRKMKGIESKGMLLASVSEDKKEIVLVCPEKKVKEGNKVS